MISNRLLTDRADIVGRPQSVSNFEVVGEAEVARACNVPCLIVTVLPSRLASLFGFQQTTSLTCLMNGQANVVQGDVIVAQPAGTRFQVKRVSKYPAAHKVRFLVLDIVEDLGEAV